MTRNYLLYVTIILAVALFIMTVPYWVLYVIEALFVDGSNNIELPGVPPPWASHQWESDNRTEANYVAKYTDCTLHVTKSGTSTTSVTVDTSMVCAQEEGGRSIIGDEGRDIEFDTVPADFEVDWTVDKCDMVSSYEEWDGIEGERVAQSIRCYR